MGRILFYGFALAVSFLLACSDPPDYPIEPQIEFVGISKDTLSQSDLNEDSLLIRISYTDGDGDLGVDGDSPEQSIFVTDLRNGQLLDQAKIPKVPEQGSSNGIFGELEFRLYTTCCLFPDLIPPCSNPAQYPTDTVVFEIYITDRAGHESNRVQTSPILLLCD